jgi:hypothetical protein
MSPDTWLAGNVICTLVGGRPRHPSVKAAPDMKWWKNPQFSQTKNAPILTKDEMTSSFTHEMNT